MNEFVHRPGTRGDFIGLRPKKSHFEFAPADCVELQALFIETVDNSIHLRFIFGTL